MNWADYIGQEEVVSELQDYIALARKGHRFPPVLLMGPKGLGKTTLARLVAADFGKEVQEINLGSADKQKWDGFWRNFYAPQHVAFVDELSQGNRYIQQDLMDKMLNGSYGERPVIISASMERKGIIGALIDRFKTGYIGNLQKYSKADLLKIAKVMAKGHKVDLSEDMLIRLTMACDGSLRELDGIILGAWKDQMLEREVNPDIVLAARGLDKFGYSIFHYQIVEALEEQSNKTLSTDSVAWLLDVPKQDAVEYLTRLKAEQFVEVTGKGVTLTRKGSLFLQQRN